MSQHAALPDAWVAEIFRRLALTYGRDFLSRWEGLDLADVRADWGQQLAGFSGPSIGHAIENLPSGQPPTVLQFRDLCRLRPESAPLALAAPAAGDIPPAVAAQLARAKAIAADRNRLQWAYDLQAREGGQTKHTSGSVRLTQAQRDAWRVALASSTVDTSGLRVDYTPPPADCLPPAMRAGGAA